MTCPVCGSASIRPSVEKSGVPYLSCSNCDALFSGALDANVIQTHNEGPDARADIDLQITRLQRTTDRLGSKPQKMLDFGCGQGQYLRFLQKQGINAVGIDQNTELRLEDIAPASLDAINMVEVIEHLPDPLAILKGLANLLKPGGVIYIESSFVDFLGDPARSDYVDPRIGHCCIQSRKSMDYLAKKLGLRQIWINNNVVVMHKDAQKTVLTPFWH